MGFLWFALSPLGQPAEVLAAMPLYWALMALVLVPTSVSTVFRCTWEAVGRPWLGVAFAGLSLGAKVPLTVLLVHSAGLGLVGAGLATLLAESLAALGAWAYWRRARSMRRLRLRRRMAWAEVASAPARAPPSAPSTWPRPGRWPSSP
jgi:MATE family multidrug resistance protein